MKSRLKFNIFISFHFDYTIKYILYSKILYRIYIFYAKVAINMATSLHTRFVERYIASSVGLWQQSGKGMRVISRLRNSFLDQIGTMS